MQKSLLIALSVFTLFSFELKAQSTDLFFEKADTFFKNYTENGSVNYKKLKGDPAALNELIEMASVVEVSESKANDFQAFWINAYNVALIKGIIDNYPIASPLDKAGFFDKTTYQLAGQKITLNDIENKKLRAKFNDARFHFVLVCGAKGCPPIISKAYLPNTLNEQLESQTKIALNNDAFIKVSGKKVAFSEIFKWYKEDFVKEGNEIDYLNSYRSEKVPSNSKITYYPYDWRLNGN